MRQLNYWGSWASFLTVIIAATVINAWTLNSAHYFYADDWGWLERVAFHRWWGELRLFPVQIYNDRPAGEIFIIAMYGLFGLNSHAFNVLGLVLHVVNSVIFLWLCRRVLPAHRAWLAAMLGAAWFCTLMAVHWTAAIFDLAGATWCLLCISLYIKSAEATHGAPWWLVGAVLMHVLAIRCKEFAITLVFVLAIWDFLLIVGQSLKRRLLRLSPHIVITFIYGVVYLGLYHKAATFVSAGAYQLSPTPVTILDNVTYYLQQAFYLPARWSPVAGYLAIGMVMLIGATSKQALVGLLTALALMAAVLVMPHQQNVLYLYVPHFFMAMALCAVKPRDLRVTLPTASFVACLLCWPLYSHQWRWTRDFYLKIGGYSERLVDSYLQQMKGQPVPRRLTIGVSQTYFDPFSWGQGAFLRIYYHDKNIQARVVKLNGSNDHICEQVSGACFVEEGGRLVRRH